MAAAQSPSLVIPSRRRSRRRIQLRIRVRFEFGFSIGFDRRRVSPPLWLTGQAPVAACCRNWLLVAANSLLLVACGRPFRAGRPNWPPCCSLAGVCLARSRARALHRCRKRQSERCSQLSRSASPTGWSWLAGAGWRPRRQSQRASLATCCRLARKQQASSANRKEREETPTAAAAAALCLSRVFAS